MSDKGLALYFVNDDDSFSENIEYHLTPIIEGDQSPEDAVASLVRGWTEWAIEVETPDQSLSEMLEALTAFLRRARLHALAQMGALELAIQEAVSQERAS